MSPKPFSLENAKKRIELIREIDRLAKLAEMVKAVPEPSTRKKLAKRLMTVYKEIKKEVNEAWILKKS